MKVKKTSSNASYDFVATFPIRLCTLDWIYIFNQIYFIELKCEKIYL